MPHQTWNRSLVRPLLAAIVSGCLVACNNESPEQLLASAKSYLHGNQPDAAVIQLNNALQKRPNYGEARYLLGKLMFDKGDATAAVTELGKANNLRYAPDEVVPLLAKALLLAGEPGKVIALDHDFPLESPQAVADLKTTVAIAHAKAGDGQKALADIAAALQAKPEWAPALLIRADEFAARRQFVQANQIVDSVLARAPDTPDALVFKADLMRQAGGDPEAAIALYRRALQAEPGDLPAFGALVDQMLVKNDFEGARRQIDAMNQLRPGAAAVIYFRARLAAQQGDLKTADQLLQPLLGAEQQEERVLGLAGWVALKQGQWLVAQKHLGRIVQRKGLAPEARQLLAQAYLRSGEPARAIETLDPLLETPRPDARTLSLAAGAHLLLGDAGTAEALYRRATESQPADPHDRTGFAVARLLGDDPDNGLNALESVSADAAGTDADLALVSALVARHDFDRALKVMDRMQARSPDRPEPAQLRAQLLALRGDLPAARASYEKALAIDANFYPAIDGLAALDFRQGRPAAARARFQAVLAAHPQHVRAMVALAKLDDLAGAPQAVVADQLAKAIAVKPDEVSLRRELVQFYRGKGDHKKALGVAQNAAAALPGDPDALALLASAQLSAGDVHQAVDSYARLNALRPRTVKFLLGLAQAQLADKDIAGATTTLAKAAALSPDSPEVVRASAQIDVQAGRPEAALAKARALQARQPKSADAFALEGDLEAMSHHWMGAARAYRAALQRDPSSTVLAQGLYRGLRAAGDAAGSDAFAAGWIADHPSDVRFIFFMALQAITNQQFARAEAYLRQGLRLDRDNAMAMNNLAWVLLAEKNPEALQVAERANALAPNQPVLMDTLAQVLAGQGQLPRALDVQRKALEIAPDAHDLRLRMARYLVDHGDKAAARTELDTLSRLGSAYPRQSEVHELLVRLQGGVGQGPPKVSKDLT
jgi:cellulose synthase operon protein C